MFTLCYMNCFYMSHMQDMHIHVCTTHSCAFCAEIELHCLEVHVHVCRPCKDPLVYHRSIGPCFKICPCHAGYMYPFCVCVTTTSGLLVNMHCTVELWCRPSVVFTFICSCGPQAILPSPCTPADGHKVLQTFCKANADLIIFGMTAVASKAFVQTCFELFQPLIVEKAQKVLSTLPPSCFSLVSNKSLFLIC